jgi:hypothetical protein
MSPATAAALSGVPVDKAGVGSAVVNTARQLGGSIGIALLGAIVARGVAGGQTPEAFVHGLSNALLVACALAALASVIAAALVRSHAARDEIETAALTSEAQRLERRHEDEIAA